MLYHFAKSKLVLIALIFQILFPVFHAQSVSRSDGTTFFMLRDPDDGLCLSNGLFEICGVNTLWYVTGKPGSYQIHHRLVDDDDDETCLDKMDCHLDTSNSKLGNCDHCGSKNWNIHGDTSTGFILTQSNDKFCVQRSGSNAIVGICSSGYVELSLEFKTKSEIKLMSNEVSRYVTAAKNGDIHYIKSFLSLSTNDINAKDWDDVSALSAASSSGQLSTVKYLLENGANLKVTDKDNISPLMECIASGHVQVFRTLISAGADIRTKSTIGVTALWLASANGHLEMVTTLLALKADPNTRRDDGVSSLLVAASHNHTDIVRTLLEGGANIHDIDSQNRSALILAAEFNNPDLISTLLRYGANPNLLSSTGFSPLISASASGHFEVVKCLVEAGADVNLLHPQRVDALMYASAGGHFEIVKYLLEKGSDVTLVHDQGGTALFEAASTGNMDVIQLLYDRGARVDIVDDDGISSLISAASQKGVDAVRFFISKELDVNHVADSGATALIVAASAGFDEVCLALLAAGANVNAVVEATPEYMEKFAEEVAAGRKVETEPHKNGLSSLMVAANEGHVETIKLLIEARADVLATDDEGDSALVSALKANHTFAALYLVEHGANPNDSFEDEKEVVHNILIDAIMSQHAELADALVSHGADVHVVDKEGVSALVLASYFGLSKVVKSLIQKGSNVHATALDGMTSLIVASSEGHVDIVRFIADFDPSTLNAKDEDGTNALMVACANSNVEMVKTLVEKGININDQNLDGHTALIFAMNTKRQIDVLLEKYKDFLTTSNENDNSLTMIKAARESQIRVIEFLRNSGADASIKDKEGHVAADFDYIPGQVKLESDKRGSEYQDL